MEDVEPVGAAANLDEQPLVLIPDPQDSVINHHLGPSLIQLAKTHDRVAKGGDVVHTMKHPVLAVLRLEDDGADAVNLHL